MLTYYRVPRPVRITHSLHECYMNIQTVLLKVLILCLVAMVMLMRYLKKIKLQYLKCWLRIHILWVTLSIWYWNLRYVLRVKVSNLQLAWQSVRGHNE